MAGRLAAFREFVVAFWRSTSAEARAGLVFGPAALLLYNAYVIAPAMMGPEADSYGLALRLHVMGHKILVVLLFAWILARVTRGDLFGWLLCGGGLFMVVFSTFEYLQCSMYSDPRDRAAIEAWGAGIRHRCATVVNPLAPYVPWAVFAPAFAYVVFRFARPMWRRK